MRFILTLCAAIGVVAGAADPVLAQAYPTKPIKMMVPAGAGGPTDVLARLIGDRMTAALDNRW